MRSKQSNNQIRVCILLVVFAGVLFRFLVMTIGHNYDFESYCIVGDYASRLKNVYANTERYNYAPIFFCIQGILYKIAHFSSKDPILVFRILIVSLLTVTDLGIFLWIARKYSLKKAIIFFLNPISIIITGYHNQFDNMAVLLALYSCLFYNEEEEFNFNDACFVISFSASLMMKHIFIIFPFWILIKKGLPLKKRILYSFFPPTIFLVSFIPFIIGNKTALYGIINNVFLYRSFNNAPLLYKLFMFIHLPEQCWFFVFVGVLMLSAYILREQDYTYQVLMYSVIMVAFSSAVANQYLVIPLVAICAFGNSFIKAIYFIYVGCYLLLETSVLSFGNSNYIIYYILGKAPYTVAVWILLILVLTELMRIKKLRFADVIERYLEKGLEYTYLGVMGIFVSNTLLIGTSFGALLTEEAEWVLRIVLCIVIVMKIWYYERIKIADLFLMLLTLLVFFFAWRHTQYGFLLNIPLLMAGAANLPYKKILKVGFWSLFCILAAGMFGTFIGAINELVYVRGYPAEHSFGIYYPTDYAALVFYVVIFAWVLYSDISSLWIAIIAIAAAWFVNTYAGAATSAGMLCISAAGMLYVNLRTSCLSKINVLDKLCKGFEWLLTFSVPLAAIAAITLTFVFDENKPWMKKVNILSHGRLGLGKRAIEAYGLKGLGTPFDMRGTLWTPEGISAPNYNFVDSSYVLIAVKYGVLTLILISFLIVLCSQKALKRGQIKVAIALVFIAGHSVMEHRFISIGYNLFLLIPFADFQMDFNSTSITGKQRFCYYLYVGIAGCGAVIAFPGLVMFLRTAVYTICQRIVLRNFLFLVIVALSLYMIYQILHIGLQIFLCFVDHILLSKQMVRELMIWVVIACVLFGLNAITIGYGHKGYTESINKERPVLEALSLRDEITGVYIDDVPLYYCKEFKKVAFSPYRQEGLVDRNNIVILTPTKSEIKTLTAHGFCYGELSDTHMIYTNSEVAKKVLAEYGIELIN